MTLTLSQVNAFVGKYLVPVIHEFGYHVAWSGFKEHVNSLDVTGAWIATPDDKPNLHPVIRTVTLYGADAIFNQGPQSVFGLVESKMASAVNGLCWMLRARVVAWRILDLVEKPVEDQYERMPFSIKRMSPYVPDGMRNWDMAAIEAVDQIIKGGVFDAS